MGGTKYLTTFKLIVKFCVTGDPSASGGTGELISGGADKSKIVETLP